VKKTRESSIPEGWMLRKLGELFSIEKEQISIDDPSFNKLPFIGLENIEANSRRYIANKDNSKEGKSTSFLFDDKLLLYGKLRPYLNKVYLPNKQGRCSMELLPLKPKPGFTREFIAFILQSHSVVDYATKNSTGGRMPRANMNHLIKFEVSVPIHQNEQNAIVRVLERKMAEVEKMRQAALRQKEAAAAQKVKVLLKAFPFKNGDKLPEGWKWAKCQDIIDVRDGTHDTPAYIEKGIPLVTSKNLKNGQIDFETAKFISTDDHKVIEQRSKVDDGDILFAMIGTIGNPVIVKKDRDFSIKNIALFKFKNSPISTKFFYHLLSSQIINEQLLKITQGGIQNFVSLQFLRGLSIPVPYSSVVQKQIAEKLDKDMKEIERVSQAIDFQLEAIQALPGAILREVFDFQEANA